MRSQADVKGSEAVKKGSRRLPQAAAIPMESLQIAKEAPMAEQEALKFREKAV